MRLYAGILIGATLATPIAGAVAYTTVADATRQTDARHMEGHATVEAECVAMAEASIRVQKRASMLLWAQRGPTGGEMPGTITLTTREE